ncbi:MAG: RdgB/HAM1 family non-canonical purine NTP pyrophosphatase [Planctomycetota bacterium]
MRLLLASGNRKKLLELQRVAAPLGVEVVQPSDVGGLPEVVEDGATFAANAAKKAISGARHAGLWTLADDSGLEVDALGGAPGVYSARYAGVHGDDEGNNRKLLRELADVPDGSRGASFVCALALARPETGEIAHETEGRTFGRILREPRGEGGFGYDPLFEFVEEGFPATGMVFATLSADEKAAVSHRGRALRALEPALTALLGSA